MGRIPVHNPLFARLILLFVATLICGIGNAYAEGRVALVVGNSAYQNVGQLRNPRNDAEDMTAKLTGLGFEVFGGTDLDRRGLVQALIQFGRAAETAEVALFFYAGHGLQVNGENYLVPVDANVEFEAEIALSLVSLSGVMQQMDRGSRTNIVFLDACRDNPFAKQLARSMNRSAESLQKGLGRIQSGRGTFIAFATQPDNVASDGGGRNSPFTTALLKNIDRPGLSISDVMIEVRNEVIDATGGNQVPWDSSSLTGRFSFRDDVAQSTGNGQIPPVAPSTPVSSESAAFEQASRIDTCGAYQAFEKRFPDTFQAELARERMKALCEADKPAAPQIAMVTRAARPEGICADRGDGVNYCVSSVLPPIKANRYDPSMLFDGKGATAWVENRPDDGVGEFITMHFDRERPLAGFEISNGYDKDENTWANNGRIGLIDVITSDGRSFTAELPDVRGGNRFDFSQPIATSSLKIVIRSAVAGRKFKDTAVSELSPIFAD